MWYLFVVILALILIFLSSETKINYIFDDGGRVEIHFVFFSLHLTRGNKRRRRRAKFPRGNILRATRELLGSSSVVVNRLSIPVNSSPTVPGTKFLGVNISYPLIYAYLTANSRKLTISENAVIKESTEDFRFLVNISLQTATVNLLRALFTMLFTTKRRGEA